jgi:hypothetical protein
MAPSRYAHDAVPRGQGRHKIVEDVRRIAATR